MANYATNIFHARTENKTDLDKIEAFLDDTFSEFTNRYGDSVDAEFSSRWVYPEEEIKKLVESLEDKDKVYIKILTYEFEDEYVSFRIFSQGEWKVKLITEWVEEDKVKELSQKFTDIINNDGKVEKVEDLGKKKLAYEVKKNKEGYYVVINFDANPNLISELERNYRIMDEVIKFITIKAE